MFRDFFSSTASPAVPQHNSQMFKFKLGDTVAIDLTPTQRKTLGFKYSLHPGQYIDVYFKKVSIIL